MKQSKKKVEVGALVEFNGVVARVKQIFERPTYFVEDLNGMEMFVPVADAKRVSAIAEVEIWKERALKAEGGPKTVTLTLERDGVINGVMCPAGQYRVTEQPSAPSIITRIETVEPPAAPLVQIPSDDDTPYTAHCSECEFTQVFPDEVDAASEMVKAGWRFDGGNAICPAHK
jgi:hypothetical protein